MLRFENHQRALFHCGLFHSDHMCGTSARLRRMNLTPGHLEFPTRDLFSGGVHNSDKDQDPCDKGLPFTKELTTVEDQNGRNPTAAN